MDHADVPRALSGVRKRTAFLQLPKTGLELLRIVLYPIAEHIL